MYVAPVLLIFSMDLRIDVCDIIYFGSVCWTKNIHLPETLFAHQFVKVSDNLVEQAQTFDALVVGLQLDIKLGKIWYRGEHDACTFALFVVEFLHICIRSISA